MERRYIQKQVKKDLPKKMDFISEPRQVGKTTLALSILKRELLSCFDEINKYKYWSQAV